MIRPAVVARTGEAFDFGGLGIDWKIGGEETGDRFTVVHHPPAPRAVAAPLHRHHGWISTAYPGCASDSA